MLKLLELMSCKVRAGRAAAAPSMRRERLTAETLASSRAVVGAEHDVECDVLFWSPEVDAAQQPHDEELLPHQYQGEARMFPVVESPPDRSNLHEHDACDYFEAKGLEVAKAIMKRSQQFGRRRHHVQEART